MSKRVERFLPVLFAAMVVLLVAGGAFASCGDDAPQPYGSSVGALRQYHDLVDNCEIEQIGTQVCCYEEVSPVSEKCPGATGLRPEGETTRVKAACAARRSDLFITWEEVDQLGNRYEACGPSVTEHRFCRCASR